jgi:hypothetical protein
MDTNNRPDHIEDVLIKLHTGQWFGWTDSKNKVYANLEIYPVDGVTHDKPTKASLESALTAEQAAFDAAEYSRSRAAAYPSIDTFMEAYTEKEIGGDSTKWDAYVSVYNKVRTDHPKA